MLAVSTGHILVLRCKTCALLRAKTSALLRRKTCAVLRPLPKIRPDLSPARPDVSGDRKSKENLCKIEVLDQKTTFSTGKCKKSYGDLTFVGTSATECTFLLFHLKYLILYEAFIDICIFKLTFYEAFLTVAMQKYREGCTFSSKISASRRRNPTLESAAGSRGSSGSAGSDVIGRGAQPQ